jgi:hypothetical protein
MPNRRRIKDKRVQVLLMLLTLAIFLFVALDTLVDICLASILAGGEQIVEGETLRTWSRAISRGRRYHYVAYSFEVEGETYKGEHRVPGEVMDQARKDGVVPIHFLERTPAIHAPPFWGESLLGYLLSSGWAALALLGLSAVFIMALLGK